jgi:hypothetical protein
MALVALLLQAGCSGNASNDGSAAEAADAGARTLGAPGSTFEAPEGTKLEDWYEFSTDDVTVPAGEEFFMCYVGTIPSAMNIDQFRYVAQPGVHHIALEKLTAPEDRRSFECNVLFDPTWMPIFGTGIGDQDLALPEGSAQVLPEGTQLLIQLHLFNTTTEPITTSTKVHLHQTHVPDPSPVGFYVFGTSEVTLPPASKSTVSNDCAVPDDVTVAAMLPHMHYLGKSLTLEVGDPNDPTAPMREVYRRDPYDFNNQYVEPFDLTIPAGAPTRVTCSYENDGPETVTFGESSNDEMCFLVTYQVGFDGQSGCVTFDPEKLKQLTGG